jgi:hypothetical protein
LGKLQDLLLDVIHPTEEMKLGILSIPNFHKGNTHSPYDGSDFGSISLEPASPIVTNRQQSPFLFALGGSTASNHHSYKATQEVL